MLKHIAQDITVAASNIIGYSVLLTGKDSIVLGATNPERIGTLHEASMEVIRTGQQLVHDEGQAANLRGTKPGTTLPIVIGDEVVGTIGISGDPEDVVRYGLLIKMMAGVFLRDRLEMESIQMREHRRQTLLREIVTFDERRDHLEGLLDRGRILGYDLTQMRAAVMIQVGDQEPYHAAADKMGTEESNSTTYRLIKEGYGGAQDIAAIWRTSDYLVFASGQAGRNQESQRRNLKESLRDKNTRLITRFRDLGKEVYIGIGNPASGIVAMKKSYEEADQALFVAKTRRSQGCICADDIFIEKLIMGMPESVYADFVEEKLNRIFKEKNCKELIDLIVYWCESKFNFAQTARLLNIHKNTLDYRFKRAEAILDIDLQNFNDALAMYMVVMIYHIKGR